MGDALFSCAGSEYRVFFSSSRKSADIRIAHAAALGLESLESLWGLLSPFVVLQGGAQPDLANGNESEGESHEAYRSGLDQGHLYGFNASWENRMIPLSLITFYGYYLQSTDADHPGKKQIVASMEPIGERSFLICWSPRGQCIYFLSEADGAPYVLKRLRINAAGILVRDPIEMIPSLRETTNLRPSCHGLTRSMDPFQRLIKNGHTPIVIDARAVLEDPAGQLKALCERLDLTFDPAMLSWPAGRRETDGVWARYWYEAVEQTTGFQSYRSKQRAIPTHLRDVYVEAVQIYKKLKAFCSD